MRISIIGGMDRSAGDLRRIAKKAGHKVESHTGRVGGRGAKEVRAMVRRSDVVVVVTRVNSHGGMNVAKDAARQYDRPLVITRTCSPSRFQDIVARLSR